MNKLLLDNMTFENDWCFGIKRMYFFFFLQSMAAFYLPMTKVTVLKSIRELFTAKLCHYTVLHCH